MKTENLSSENENGNNVNTVLCAGNFYPHKYWECECCGLLISMPQQDNVSKYDCPACKISKCEHGGKFIEISLQEFCRNANIACHNLKNEQQCAIHDVSDSAFWNDDKVIDFVNWYIELHKLDFRYPLENRTIVESFKNGDDASKWHCH